ncbi:ArsR family transcriptional regulator [Nocardioides campestrisoli]|uniref:ArsR family transcriptional regulator n=1 Tax=Nocardioides campestrisoli TaxID=2736757 RepID=UPI00163DC98C|nr:ArsR family transcriptional regulator [Nocardioides campestrisoli]
MRSLRQVGGDDRAHDPEPVTLGHAHQVFTRWLGADYDLDVLDAVLACAAVERLGGDPAWLLVVSGSGAAKTETVAPLALAGAHVTSTISSEGALLSGTSKKERTATATGGLLRKIGPSGVLVIKDVTSILSMNRDARGAVLAALREVYDGKWERNLGSDGGQSLAWLGRLVVIGAVTTAWDRAHEVVSSMGDRFVLIRLDSSKGRVASGRQAIANTGDEERMRLQLGQAVAGVLAGVDTTVDLAPTSEEATLILALANVVTLARTGVEHDYRGDVVDAHAPEMPTRFAKQLTQVLRGGIALGIDRGHMLKIVARCAADSMPPLRLAVLVDLHANPGSTTQEVRRRIDKPRATVDRTLQALHMLGLATLQELEQGPTRTVWRYSLARDVDIDALTRLTMSQKCQEEDTPLSHTNSTCSDKSGTTLEATCTECTEPLWPALASAGDTTHPNCGWEATHAP